MMKQSLSDGEKLMAIGLWMGIRMAVIAGALGLFKIGQFVVVRLV
jgi:hypothetical protein